MKRPQLLPELRSTFQTHRRRIAGGAGGSPPGRRPRTGFRRVLGWSALSVLTAFVSRWLSNTLASRPAVRRPAPPAACVPAAAREEQRLADTVAWRVVEGWLARRALRPFRVRPGFAPLRVLNVDHGPGGVALALARHAPQDATIVATDSLPGMADLAYHRAARRGVDRDARVRFLRAWAYALPFQSEVFDLVVCAGAMHQWPNPEPPLAEIRRVLAPRGRYLVLDFRRAQQRWLWVLVRAAQALFVSRNLRAEDEPSASIAAAYAPPEAEWLAARAKLPDLQVTFGPAWIMMETGDVAPRNAAAGRPS